MTNVIRKIKTVVGCGLLAMLTACNGILDDIYDEPATPAAGDIYIDASDWTQWHYIDLHALKEAADKGEKPEQVYTTYEIPLEKTDSFDEDKTGIYTYWYDVFAAGHLCPKRQATARLQARHHSTIAGCGDGYAYTQDVG